MTVVTRGEQMLALRRSRMKAAPAFLRGGFRPFFFLGASWALVVVALWVLAMAGSLARKKLTPAGPGTLPTHTPLFVVMLVSVVIVVGALTFIPSLALGPIVEHLQMVESTKM